MHGQRPQGSLVAAGTGPEAGVGVGCGGVWEGRALGWNELEGAAGAEAGSPRPFR